MSRIVRTINLPRGLTPDVSQYTVNQFRPAVLEERYTLHRDLGTGPRENYSVTISGPRLKKNGEDHATSQGSVRYTDAAAASRYDPDVAGTPYARFLLGRAALGDLVKPPQATS